MSSGVEHDIAEILRYICIFEKVLHDKKDVHSVGSGTSHMYDTAGVFRFFTML